MAGGIFACLGWLFAAYIVLKVSAFVYQRFVRKADWKAYKGKWAVVTGASEGIGAGYARALARRGMHVVLMSRTKDKLQELAAEISQAHGVQARVVPFDFLAEPEAYEAVRSELKQLEVAVLVNNVGGAGLPTAEALERFSLKFDEHPVRDHLLFVRINLHPTLIMSSIVLPGMKARRQGRIINVSSLTSTMGLPVLQPYGATKAFIDNFTKAMIPELLPTGVVMESHAPGNVHSVVNPSPINIDCLDATVYATYSLDMFGTGPLVIPYWFHAIESFVLQRLPLSFILRFMEKEVLRVAKEHRATREAETKAEAKTEAKKKA